jgi:hypothetical protein
LAITGEQLRAGRAIVRLEQVDVAQRAGVSVDTVKRLESIVGPVSANISTIESLQSTLEAAGVIFVAENGGGPGVRLRKKLESPAELTQRIEAMEADLAKTDADPANASGRHAATGTSPQT